MIEGLIEKAQQQQAETAKQTDWLHGIAATDKVQQAVLVAAQAIVEAIRIHEPNVSVKNQPAFPKSISTPDVQKVVDAVNKLNITTATKELDLAPVVKGLSELVKITKAIPKVELPEAPESVAVNNLDPLIKAVEALSKRWDKVNLSPTIEVAAPVISNEVDLSPIETKLDEVTKAVGAIKIPTYKVPDNQAVLEGLQAVKDAIANLRFPVPNFIADPLIAYKIADVDDASSIKYYGRIANDGKWVVMKEDTSVAPKTYRYAASSGSYATNWDNRASLTYDYLNIAING